MRARCLPLAFGWLVLGGLSACAGDYASQYRRSHPEFRPGPPAADAPFGASVAALYADPGPDASVSVEELRMLQVDVEPWVALDADEAAQRPGQVGVIAGRRCRIREGFRLREEDAASWMVFVDGRLQAYGHVAFDERCDKKEHFRPAATEWVAAERGLVRYVGQRYPRVRPSPEELAERGFAFFEAGRLPEVRHVLRGLDRTIDQLKIEQDTGYDLEPAELAELDALETKLRTERAKLRRALKRAEREAEARASESQSAPTGD